MDRHAIREHNTMMARFLCKKHGCTEELAEEHLDMILNRAWNPHPSEEFISWWQTQPEFRQNGLDVVRARNNKAFTDRFKEDVQIGLATLPIDYPTSRHARAA